MSLFNSLSLQLRIVRFQKQRVRRLCEGIEATLKSFVVFSDSLRKARSITAGKVDHRMDVLAVHNREQLLRSSEVLSFGNQRHPSFRLRGDRDVGMDIDYWKARPIDMRLRNLEHALRLIVRKAQRFWMIVRTLGGLGKSCTIGNRSPDQSQSGRIQHLTTIHRWLSPDLLRLDLLGTEGPKRISAGQ